jgi:hypothetical protein
MALARPTPSFDPVLILRGAIVGAVGWATLLVNPHRTVTATIDPGLASIFVAIIAGAFMLLGQLLAERRSHREQVRDLEERLARLEGLKHFDRRRAQEGTE